MVTKRREDAGNMLWPLYGFHLSKSIGFSVFYESFTDRRTVRGRNRRTDGPTDGKKGINDKLSVPPPLKAALAVLMFFLVGWKLASVLLG